MGLVHESITYISSNKLFSWEFHELGGLGYGFLELWPKLGEEEYLLLINFLGVSLAFGTIHIKIGSGREVDGIGGELLICFGSLVTSWGSI